MMMSSEACYSSNAMIPVVEMLMMMLMMLHIDIELYYVHATAVLVYKTTRRFVAGSSSWINSGALNSFVYLLWIGCTVVGYTRIQ